VDPDPPLISVGWIRIQVGKNAHKKVKKYVVLKCLIFSFEGWRLLL
jgi:hypothetical protein